MCILLLNTLVCIFGFQSKWKMVLQKKKYRERLDYMKENEDAAVKVCSYHREWQNYYSARKIVLVHFFI